MIKQRCRLAKETSKVSNFTIYLTILFFPAVGIALLGLSIWTLCLSIADREPIGLVFVSQLSLWSTSCFIFVLGWCFFSDASAIYSFQPEGVYVKYPLQRALLIPWNRFQQVCVCYANYITKGQITANSVICCVKKGEKTNIYGRWKTDNPFRFRNVLCLDYSQEQLETIRKYCPYDIPDLRNSGNYRI